MLFILPEKGRSQFCPLVLYWNFSSYSEDAQVHMADDLSWRLPS